MATTSLRCRRHHGRSILDARPGSPSAAVAVWTTPGTDERPPHSLEKPEKPGKDFEVVDTDPRSPFSAAVWGDEAPTAQAAVQLAANRMTKPSDPKATARPASALAAAAGPTVTADGIGADRALDIFENVIAPATRAQDDPLNLAYIPAAPTRASLAFDAVVSSYNIFAGTWEAGAGAVFAENEALAWLVSLLGWPATAGGCFVSGGTVGNLSALATARHTALARRGGRPPGGWKVVCTTSAHSSVVSDARVLDVGVIQVAEDERGHLTGPALAAAIADEPGVFAVVASAGTTNSGVIDDLSDIADVCQREHIWLHVDGAYGGAALAAPSARARFAGLERADSFIIDPHKWLFAPYDCCALLYRDPVLARNAHSQHASYLDHIDREVWNPADLAIHLSRRARGLPFWFSLAVHGTARYTRAIEQTLATARAVAAGIRTIDTLALILDPELSVVLFERPGWTAREYYEWSDALSREGRMLCVPTQWCGRTVLRLVFINPATESEQVLQILRETTG